VKRSLGAAAGAALLVCTIAFAREGAEIFDAPDHCVAYRTSKGMLFSSNTEVLGRSCEVTASLVTDPGGAPPRVVVGVPVASLDSDNFMRDRAVSDLLGADAQPDLRFTSSPLDAASLRTGVAQGRFVLPGTLRIGGTGYPVEFPLEVVEHGGRHYVKGQLDSTFEAFGVEVPTIAFGLVAKPHEDLTLIVHLELERVDGLEAWARSEGLLEPQGASS
jgi:polyisoprenoid-binding protein YceI